MKIHALVIAVAGITITAIGLCGIILSQKYLDFVNGDCFFFHIPIIMLGFMISAIGFSGLWNGNYRQGLPLLLAIICYICLFMMQSMVVRMVHGNRIERYMRRGMEKYGKEDHGGFSGNWDLMQREQQCCGTHNFMDWSGVGNYSEGQTPDSCCKKVPEVVGCGLSTDAGTKNAGGCLKPFDDMFLNYFDIMVLVVLGIGIGVFIALGEDEEAGGIWDDL